MTISSRRSAAARATSAVERISATWRSTWREHYVDFGPIFAAEKLIERHRIAVSKETLRQWVIEAGIWVSRRERKQRVQTSQVLNGFVRAVCLECA